jgi:MFS family permease
MLDLSLFRISSFAGSNVVALLVSLGMFGVFFFVSLYVQNILGYSPTKAGATFLPMTLLIVVIAPIAGNLSDRLGSRWLMGAGMTLLGIGGLLYQRIGVHTSYWVLLPPMLVGGIGMAMTMSPMTSAAMASVPIDKAGVGSGVLNSFRQVGGSLGIALMGAILASYVQPHVVPPQAAQNFVDGLHAALITSACIAFAAALVAVVMVKPSRRGEQRLAAEQIAA